MRADLAGVFGAMLAGWGIAAPVLATGQDLALQTMEELR